MKEPMREPFRCDGCGKVENRPNDRSQYCDCDKGAPFRMMPVSVVMAVNTALKHTALRGLKQFTWKGSVK